MSRMIALVVALTLIVPAPAAAGMRVAVRGQDSNTIGRYLRQLPVGSEVDVRLADRSRFRAFLMGVEGTDLIVMPKTRLPVPQRRLAFDSVEFVELRSGRGGVNPAAAIGIGAAVGAGVFFGLLLVALAASD